MVGRELPDVNVVDIKPWVMHAEVAEKYLACENRIILAGDAAHRFPPAGGFGTVNISAKIYEIFLVNMMENFPLIFNFSSCFKYAISLVGTC